MKVKKLYLESFKQNELSFTSLKNLLGGARYTDYKAPGDRGDFVMDNDMTKYDCEDPLYDDSCPTP